MRAVQPKCRFGETSLGFSSLPQGSSTKIETAAAAHETRSHGSRLSSQEPIFPRGESQRTLFLGEVLRKRAEFSRRRAGDSMRNPLRRVKVTHGNNHTIFSE